MDDFNLSAPPNFRGLHPDLPVTMYHRHLPHWRQEGAIYFVTFRLADALPQDKLDYLKRLRAAPVPEKSEFTYKDYINGRLPLPDNLPDVMTLSKSLTGGTLPLAVTVASDRVFRACWSDDAAAARSRVLELYQGPPFELAPLPGASPTRSGVIEALSSLEVERIVPWAKSAAAKPHQICCLNR